MSFSIAAPKNRRLKIPAVCGAALFVLGSGTYAEEIRVTPGACGESVGLVAQDAPLSSVLKRLGQSLGFELVYQSQRDPLITRDERSSPVALILDLAQGMNFSVEQVMDRRCTNRNRVARVSVLPDQGDKAPMPLAKHDLRIPELERIARQGLSDYLRSHGMEDQTIESLAVK